MVRVRYMHTHTCMRILLVHISWPSGTRGGRETTRTLRVGGCGCYHKQVPKQVMFSLKKFTHTLHSVSLYIVIVLF